MFFRGGERRVMGGAGENDLGIGEASDRAGDSGASATGGLRRAGAADWRTLGRLVGQAFADDPVSRWTLGPPETIEAVFTALGRHVYLPRGICMIADQGGGTMWLGPGGSKAMPILPQLALVARLIGAGGPGAVGRALAVDRAMRRRRPAEPHFYLFAVGVAAEARGAGLGRRLIAATLEQADRAGLPAWLENSNPRNESLYRGLGFVPVETFAPAPGAPPLTTMQRPVPRPVVPHR
ncbi:GNAT family N-acetyltransferase [Sphingomonas changnyeongensis]|uniref:GNAT family N-acetyltransferase n=1 Tax=Sphingomonas changnyeongensis TaxID=2698679 RepID=A0A7Z2NYK4_9SPHN|nr:GNAT family N-acetyltransferase [Sphingomonas changnyeongensis]QHL91669.1 GNAT family N-acetyltransferase [Sphingomonas changnyeongensis]